MSELNFSLYRFFSILRYGSYSLASQAINSATNFFTGILIGRLCSKEEYGLYALGFTLVMIFNDFQTAFISTPYMVYSPRLSGDEKREYTGSTLVHQLFFSALASIMLLAGLGIVSLGIGPEGLIKVLKILSVVAVFIMLKEFIRQISFATLNTKASFLIDSSAALIQIGSLSLLAYLEILTAERAFIAVGIACGLTSLVWLIANKATFLLRSKNALPDFLRNWTFVKWVIASHILWVSTMSLYPWFIAAFLGVEANGVWAACLSIIMIGNLICVAVQNMLGPNIIHAKVQGGVLEMRNVVLKGAIIFALITIVICIFFIVAGDLLVVLFYGQKYDGNGLIVSILALNLVVQSSTFPFSRGLFAMERADIDFILNIAVIFSLIFGVWLVSIYGLLGAACGLLVANSLSVLLRGLVFRKITKKEFPNIV